MSDSSREGELLRDALDHIVRVACSARQPTRRLDWLAARARMALRGTPWSRDYLPWPRGETDERVRELNSCVRGIVKAYDEGSDDELHDAIEKARHDFPSLFQDRRRDA